MEINLEKPFVVLDIEATGDQINKDRIVEIGMIKIFPNGKEEVYEKRINPEIPIPLPISEIHGIYDLDIKCFSGVNYITEKINDLSFKISAKSFFQTNSFQTRKLYNIVKKFADLKGNETVYDLYCGIGTISLFLAKDAKKIVGIDKSKSNLEDAIKNKKNTVHETADVIYHLLVTLESAGINFDDIITELKKREGTSGFEEKKNR